jgi:hypothetical protein
MVAEGMCTNEAVQGKLEGPPKITNAQMQCEIRRPAIVVRAGWELVLKWQGSYRSCRLEGSTCPLWLGSAYECVSRLEREKNGRNGMALDKDVYESCIASYVAHSSCMCYAFVNACGFAAIQGHIRLGRSTSELGT